MASEELEQMVLDVQACLPLGQEALLRAEKWLSCRDQHETLISGVDDVLRTLRSELSAERLAETFWERREAQRVLLQEGVGILMSLFLPDHRPSSRPSPQSPPFGRVLVEVGSEGIPNGLRVVNVSSMARAEGIPVSAVEKRLAAEGRILLAPKDFVQLVTWLASKVSDGEIEIPFRPRRLGFLR